MTRWREHREVPDYRAYCPIALATGAIGDRWTPLILRELVLGSTRFNDIARGLPGLSRSLLVQRLKQLERYDIVERWPLPGGRGHEYHLTAAGKNLEPILMELGRWAVTWMYGDLRPHEIDAVTLMWWMHRRIDPDEIPERRVVVQFDHTWPERQTIWLVFDHGEPSVCIQHPGFDTDLLVTTTTPALAEVFAGFSTLRTAMANGVITVDGPRHLTRAFPRWFLWGPFAGDVIERRKTAV